MFIFCLSYVFFEWFFLVLIKVCVNVVYIVGGDILYRYYCEERYVRYLIKFIIFGFIVIIFFKNLDF